MDRPKHVEKLVGIMSDWRSQAAADELRDLLARTGLSRSEFCRRMDIDEGTLSRWLNGKTTAPRTAIAYLRVINRLMDILEIEGVRSGPDGKP